MTTKPRIDQLWDALGEGVTSLNEVNYALRPKPVKGKIKPIYQHHLLKTIRSIFVAELTLHDVPIMQVKTFEAFFGAAELSDIRNFMTIVTMIVMGDRGNPVYLGRGLWQVPGNKLMLDPQKPKVGWIADVFEARPIGGRLNRMPSWKPLTKISMKGSKEAYVRICYEYADLMRLLVEMQNRMERLQIRAKNTTKKRQ